MAPHGVIGYSIVFNFATECNQFSKLFPGISLRGASGLPLLVTIILLLTRAERTTLLPVAHLSVICMWHLYLVSCGVDVLFDCVASSQGVLFDAGPGGRSPRLRRVSCACCSPSCDERTLSCVCDPVSSGASAVFKRGLSAFVVPGGAPEVFAAAACIGLFH